MMLTEPATAPATRPRRRLRVTDSAVYVLTGFPLALVAFIVLVTGFSVAAGTLVIMVGFVVLALTLAAATGLAQVERSRLDLLLRERLPRPAYKRLRPGPAGTVLSTGADPRRWLDLLHGIVNFPVAVATFSIVTAWFAAAIGGTGYVLWSWALPDQPYDNHGLAWLVGFGDGAPADVLVTTVVGLLAAVTLPWVVRGCAAVQAGVAWALLSPLPEQRYSA